MKVGDKSIVAGCDPFIVAEVAASHNGNLETALKLVRAAKECGADAVKFQAFTPDTITFNSKSPEFIIQDGPWKGLSLHELYVMAQTPREWFPKLFSAARELGLVPFASVFSGEDIDFVMQFDPQILKIASFELVDLPLVEYAAQQKRPLIMSLGMATEEEKWEACDTALDHLSTEDIKILSCVSAYPARIEDSVISKGWHDGVSDHTIGIEVPVAATALGASIIEKHLTLSCAAGGLDDGFASEPHEFADMVRAVRAIHRALHRPEGTPRADEVHRPYRRSIYVVKDIPKGETIRPDHIRSVRPGFGLPPKHLPDLIGKKSVVDLAAGTATKWEQFQ